jgi:sulfatase modifying factor 1
LSPFKLDRFEVTVGRFRAFVGAGMGTQSAAPVAGTGAHPKIFASGWNPAWNALLPVDGAALRALLVSNAGGFATWTDAADANELLPINNVSFFLAFAFCAWDGGRLPTEAELFFVASGGSEQRDYAWGTLAPDPTFAIFNCAASPPAYDSLNGTGCAFADIVPVGSRSPKGDGRFGHADLAGSVAEITLDKRDGQPPMPCVDCARIVGPLDTSKPNIALGGSFRGNSGRLRTNDEGSTGNLSQVDTELGVRCAR